MGFWDRLLGFAPVRARRSPPEHGARPRGLYRKGSRIGPYEVYDVLGEGGFGVVYLVYSREAESVLALKTFRDEHLKDPGARARFRREAEIWVGLDRHPNLVRAHFVDEITGRLYIAMEYVASDERGLNTLRGHLKRAAPDVARAFRWSVQFCHGMEHAQARGVRCHRDVKPANIMIAQDGTLKITDFGLAGVIDASEDACPSPALPPSPDDSMRTLDGVGFGTPTYMSPEQFTSASRCDERSDVYSFGVVMYQMISGGHPPFRTPVPGGNDMEALKRYWATMYHYHKSSPVPPVDSPLFGMARRCLEKRPDDRYQSFEELRRDLEGHFDYLTGESVPAPDGRPLSDREWSNKGASLQKLGRFEEAIRCHDQALGLNPLNAKAWNNRASALYSLGHIEEGVRSVGAALDIEPDTPEFLVNRAAGLIRLGRTTEAAACADEALAVRPAFADAFGVKGDAFAEEGRHALALGCYDSALSADPRNARALAGRGNALDGLGRREEAVESYERALKIDDSLLDAWTNRGVSLHGLGRFEEACASHDRALAIDPRSVRALGNRGAALARLGRFEEAAACFEEALEIDPKQSGAWYNRAEALAALGRPELALASYRRALEIAPDRADAWMNRGNCLHGLGRFDEAVECYDRAIKILPEGGAAWHNKGHSLEAAGRTSDALGA